MARSNWQSHGDDFKKGIGKVSNKQTNSRMSFFERSNGKTYYRRTPDETVLTDFEIPALEREEDVSEDYRLSHPPDCKPCDPNISNDPYAASLPTFTGEKTGRVKYYSDYQTEKYSSEFMRFQRSLELRLRGFDSFLNEDGDITYKFCSKRSPSNYWTVTKQSTKQLYVELMCWEEIGGNYRGMVLQFNGGYEQAQTVKVINNISPTPDGGVIEVHSWSQAPNLELIGRHWYKDLSLSGGELEFTPLEFGSKWLSFFAKNPGNTNPDTGISYYDGLFFEVVEKAQTVRLVGW